METRTICFFNTNREWGGGEKWHLNTALLLKKKGYRVFIGAHKSGILLEKAEENHLPAFGISISNLSFLNPLKIRQLVSVFRKADVHTIFLNLPSDVKAAGIASKIAAVENIIYRRGTALAVNDSVLNRFLFNHVLTRIVTNSEDIKRKLFEKNHDLAPAQKVRVIYNYIDAGPYQKIKRRDNKTIVLGNAARMVNQKGQHYLIETAERLKLAGVDFILKIAGSGPLENQLKRMARQKGVDDRIVFLGFVEHIPAFLEDIDIFLFPSIHEGISNVLLEVMASGIPTVAFRVSSLPEIITHGRNGLLAEFQNVDDFAEKTLELIKNKKLGEDLGKNARTDAREKFAPDIFLEKIEDLINAG